jgi:hypothetical protein
MRNPYRCTKKSVRLSVDPALERLILHYQRRLQLDSDLRYGKDKFKVSKQYASLKLAEVLK